MESDRPAAVCAVYWSRVLHRPDAVYCMHDSQTQTARGAAKAPPSGKETNITVQGQIRQ